MLIVVWLLNFSMNHGNGYTCLGDNYIKRLLPPLSVVVYSERKELILSLRNKFSTLRLDPSSAEAQFITK